MLELFVASCRLLSQSQDMTNNETTTTPTRTFTTVHGYQGFSIRVNGVTISTLIGHGDIPSGDNREREYTVSEGIRSLWHPTQTPFETAEEIGTEVPIKDFREICRRHGLEFSSRKF